MLAVTLVRAAETVAQATAAPPLLELPRRFEFRSGPPDAKSVAVTGGGEKKTELIKLPLPETGSDVHTHDPQKQIPLLLI